MRYFIPVLLVLVALSMVPGSHCGQIPEDLDKRMEEINKWFEVRIPIYRKANYLLQKLGMEVAKLSDLHNGIDFYYQGVSDLPHFLDLPRRTSKLRIVKVNETDVDLQPVEEVVRKALEGRNVNHILQFAPEIKTAIRSIMMPKK